MSVSTLLFNLFIGINIEDLVIYALITGAVTFAATYLHTHMRHSNRIRVARPTGQLKRELANSVRTVLVFASVTTGLIAAFYLLFPGVYAWQDTLSFMKRPSVFVTFAALLPMFLVQDAYFYWTHRLMHRRPFLQIHREHHRSHNPSACTAYSFSTAEAAVHGAFVAVYGLFIPTRIETGIAFSVLALAYNAAAHSGFEFWPRWMVMHPRWGWITGTTHHDIHHAASRSNYGLYFRLWDRLMGTEEPGFESIYDYVISEGNDGGAYERLLKPRRSQADAPALVSSSRT
jgi:sterol desaturase/sphingolipid hydroxylase (fatty acid hydroxylase superfamily)